MRRPRLAAEVDPSGSIIIPTGPNEIRSFVNNSFINNLNIKLEGLIPYLYSVAIYSINDNLFLGTLEAKLAPSRYSGGSTSKKFKDLIEILGIKPTDIDYTPEEIQEYFINLHNGLLHEISRFYDTYYAQYNLPRQVQVAVMENCNRLQNIEKFFGKNIEKLDSNGDYLRSLRKDFKRVFELNKILEELCDIIHEEQKIQYERENSVPYPFENMGSKIREDLKSFLDKILQYPNLPSLSTGTSQDDALLQVQGDVRDCALEL